MATTLVKLDIHLIFHVKSTSIKLKNDDLSRLFSYVGGIIREHGAIPMAIGGMPDHRSPKAVLPTRPPAAFRPRTAQPIWRYLT